MRAAQGKPHQRTVGLDRKCKLCGGTIYFGYRGVVEGVCGRCVDLIRSTSPNPSTGPMPGGRALGRSRSLWASLFVFLLGVGAGAAALHYLGHHLPF